MDFDPEREASRVMAECVAKNKGENVAFYLALALRKAYRAGQRAGLMEASDTVQEHPDEAGDG